MPVLRLEDGGYVREVRRAGRPWQRLAVQVSRPVVHADAATASEVRSMHGIERMRLHVIEIRD
jgi:hypothetical protein